MSNLQEVIGLVDDLDLDECSVVADALRDRRKALFRQAERQALSDFAIGDPVVLHNLSPKYLNGTKGTIVAREGTTFTVKITEASDYRVSARFGSNPKVPASCVAPDPSPTQ